MHIFLIIGLSLDCVKTVIKISNTVDLILLENQNWLKKILLYPKMSRYSKIKHKGETKGTWTKAKDEINILGRNKVTAMVN